MNRIQTYTRGFLYLFLALPSISLLQAQRNTDSLRTVFQEIISSLDAHTGIALKHLGSGDTLSVNGQAHYPMQSVYKFPLGMAILNQADAGRLSLSEQVTLSTDDLRPGTWSPMRDTFPQGARLSIAEILEFTVSQSDNNGCNYLFRLLGGPAYVNDYVHSLGVKDIAIATTEAEMQKKWDVQFRNWCTPVAMTRLFELFYKGNLLSPQSRDLLWRLLTQTPTGPHRLKGLLPPGTIVGHKTGTSGTNRNGITAAVNDSGIIILPDGQALVISVFVSNSPAPTQACEDIIARLGKAAFDYYTQ